MNTKNYNEIKGTIIKTHQIAVEILDADTIVFEDLFTKAQTEVRLYGLDAPENKLNRKIKMDEQISRLPAQLLVEMGQKATDFVLEKLPPGTQCTLISERKNIVDIYGRSLAYIIMPSGACLNEVIVEEGFAKVTENYPCEKLSLYYYKSFKAKQMKKGLYQIVPFY